MKDGDYFVLFGLDLRVRTFFFAFLRFCVFFFFFFFLHLTEALGDPVLHVDLSDGDFAEQGPV